MRLAEASDEESFFLGCCESLEMYFASLPLLSYRKGEGDVAYFGPGFGLRIKNFIFLHLAKRPSR